MLGDIPLLGRLFRRETTTTKKLDLVIFLTATIVPPDEPVSVAEDRDMRELRETRAATEVQTLATETKVADVDQRTIVDSMLAVESEVKSVAGADRAALSEQDRLDQAWRKEARLKEELIRRLQAQRSAFRETLRTMQDAHEPVGDAIIGD